MDYEGDMYSLMELQYDLDRTFACHAPPTSRPADDGILWPVDHFQQASLLQQETRRMLGDLHTVTAAYHNTVAAFLDTIKPPHASPAAVDGATSAKSGMDGSSGNSTGLAADEVMAMSVMDPWLLVERGPTDVEQRANGLLQALTVQGASAMARVQEGFKGLLYTVLLRSVVTEIA